MPHPTAIDCVVFGGGAAGLWTLDALLRSGRSAVLLEAGELGSGQTVSAQGIIHGGFKYSLRGLLTASAQAIAAMPDLWRACEAGEREPTLRGMRIRAHQCHLWRTESLGSTIAMLGAGLALRVKPTTLAPHERPAALAGCPSVSRIDEQVIDPVSMLHELSTRHRGSILAIDLRSGVEVRSTAGRPGPILSLLDPRSGDVLDLAPDAVVLAAGAGNETLRTMFGLDASAAQRRPLHMTLVRGGRGQPLPFLNGHCVDGARTRVTISSAEDSAGRIVWQAGGQLAEEGVARDEADLVAHAAAELTAVLPGFDASTCEWSTYRVDRAEARVVGGRRPDDAQLLVDGPFRTLWPTKLALAPRGSELVLGSLPAALRRFDPDRVAQWTRPLVALPPWEATLRWRTA